MNSKKKRRRSTSQLSFALLVKRLVEAPCSYEEAVEVTGLHPATVSRYMRAMHEEKVLHICGWLPDAMGRDSAPVFAFGEGEDKPKKKMTPTERSRRSRHKLAKIRRDNQLKGLFPNAKPA